MRTIDLLLSETEKKGKSIDTFQYFWLFSNGTSFGFNVIEFSHTFEMIFKVLFINQHFLILVTFEYILSWFDMISLKFTLEKIEKGDKICCKLSNL